MSVPVRVNRSTKRLSISMRVSLTVIVHGRVPGSVMLMLDAIRTA